MNDYNDTSVLLKLVIQEPESPAVITFVQTQAERTGKRPAHTFPDAAFTRLITMAGMVALNYGPR